MRWALLFLLILTASPVFGGSLADFEPVLLPIAVEKVPGANNSVWSSEFWLSAEGDPLTEFLMRWAPRRIECPTCLSPGPIPARVPVRPGTYFSGGDEIPGLLFYVHRSHSTRARFSLHVRDQTRQDSGTLIPVVREEQFRAETTSIIGIRGRGDLRHMLRIYDMQRHTDARARVRLFAAGPQLLAETEVALIHDPTVKEDEGVLFPLRPSYAQVDLGHIAPHLNTFATLHIEVTPATPGLRLWSFVSVTNNETNEVTVFMPQ